MNVALTPRIAADGVVISWHWQIGERMHRIRPHAMAALALAGFGTPNVRPSLHRSMLQAEPKRDLVVRELAAADLIDAALQLSDAGVVVLALYRLVADSLQVDAYLRRGSQPRRRARGERLQENA